MNRKDFIYVSSLAALSTIIPIQSCSGDKLEDTLETPWSLTKIVDWDEIEAIGKEYIRLNPSEGDISVLKRQVLAELEKLETMDLSNTSRTDLERLVELEFKKGDFLVLHGWMISLSEARQCAMFYLIENS